MNPLVLGPLIAGVCGLAGAVLLYLTNRSANAGNERLKGIEVQMDGWERLHSADLNEQDRLKAALAEERAVSQAFASKAERLEAENVELRARLAGRGGNEQA